MISLAGLKMLDRSLVKILYQHEITSLHHGIHISSEIKRSISSLFLVILRSTYPYVRIMIAADGDNPIKHIIDLLPELIIITDKTINIINFSKEIYKIDLGSEEINKLTTGMLNRILKTDMSFHNLCGFFNGKGFNEILRHLSSARTNPMVAPKVKEEPRKHYVVKNQVTELLTENNQGGLIQDNKQENKELHGKVTEKAEEIPFSNQSHIQNQDTNALENKEKDTAPMEDTETYDNYAMRKQFPQMNNVHMHMLLHIKELLMRDERLCRVIYDLLSVSYI